jgi:ribosomal protein S18 acetylase RimI-like enzyme
VGWCQCGPRDRLEKLVSQYDLSPDNATWAVTCFVILPEYRGRGLSHRMITEVLNDLVKRGVKHVQGFPKRENSLSCAEVWTGPESVFRKAGFEIERDHPERPIYGIRFS